MDAKELEWVCNRNGFDVRYDADDSYKYVIFHPTIDGVYIDAFVTISEAEEFCDEEDIGFWHDMILSEGI